MNGHGCIAIFFLFLFLSAIILLQILSAAHGDSSHGHLKSSSWKYSKCSFRILEVISIKGKYQK